MKKSNLFFTGWILLLISLVFISSCGSGNKDRLSGTMASITTGKETELADESIDASGGEIVIDKPGDPLDGLSLAITGNETSDDYLDFRISSSHVKSFDCGPYFHPVTPLITISANGGDGSEMMTLTIPVKIPTGQFAMGFLYNKKEKTLEGMTSVDTDDDHISVLVSTSSGMQETSGGLAAQAGGGPVDVNIWQIIISAVDTSVLLKDHMTPFKPGVDDWHFTNWGSVADVGHCSGQSIGMLWYYSKKRLKGSPPLYDRFDNDDMFKTPKLWQDDVLGYKFCGTLQLDWTGMGFLHGVNRTLKLWQWGDDTRTLRSFAYALMVTDQPQLVVIHPPEEDDEHLPHAMVVYGISGGSLFIADPNYPGDTKRRIEYDRVNHRYNPYLFGENAKWIGLPYPGVRYLAKSETRSWMMASKRWGEIANKTIGNHIYPVFTIKALNDAGEYVPLTDGFHVDESGMLTLMVECSAYNPRFEAYGPDGASLSIAGNVILLPKRNGDQMVGICIKDALKDKWAGFRWVRVKVGEKGGDEVTITTDWKPKTVQPPFGEMPLTATVNGHSYTFDKGRFDININDGRFIMRGATDENGTNYFAINMYQGFKGEGEYTEFGGQWSSNTLEPWGSYGKKATDPGRFVITKWRDGRLEGNFSYTASDNGKSVTIKGEFKYKVPWHE